MTYGNTLAQESLPRGSHEIYNFGRPFLGHHYYTLRLSEPCPWVEKKKYISFTRFTQNYLPFGWGSWNLQVLVSLPYKCCIPYLVKIGPLVLEKKSFRHVARRQPIAICHLSYSGDLKPESRLFRKCVYHEGIRDLFFFCEIYSVVLETVNLDFFVPFWIQE